MARYVIGDIQGCWAELQELLRQIHYQPDADEIFLLGDLVNRGPDSLSVLRWAFQNSIRTVLGNHDLHLLAISVGAARHNRSDTLTDILAAPDRDELLDWLRRQPLLIDLPDALLVHAGILPAWDRALARSLADEVSAVLSGPDYGEFMQVMYGNTPHAWNAALSGVERWRFAVNVFTRMRMVDADGALDLDYKGELPDAPVDLAAWFDYPTRALAGQRIVFGHWSALGLMQKNDVTALDTGCIWGGALTALCLNNGRVTQAPARCAYQTISD